MSMPPPAPPLDERVTSLGDAVDPELRAELRMALATLRQARNVPGAIVTASRLLEGQGGLLGRIAAASSHALRAHFLVEQIEELLRAGLLPGDVASDAHWVRVRSNMARHRDERRALAVEDAEMAIGCTLRLVEWYYCESARGPRLPSIYAGAAALPHGPQAQAWPAPFGDLGPQLHLYFQELDRLAEEASLDQLHVPLRAVTADRQAVRLDEHVARWLEGGGGRHLAVLGDYGTGKSWFCLLLARRLADRFRADPGRSPLPLLVNFRRHEPAGDLAALVGAALLDLYSIRLPDRAAAARLLRSDRVVLILDGLDEMARQPDDHSPLLAYYRLGLPAAGARVLVTCRTHYFQSGSEQREILNADDRLLAIDRVPTFDVVHLAPFDRPALLAYLGRRVDEGARAGVLDFIDRTYNLAELCTRPVLLSLVCDSHALLAGRKEPATSAALYEAYVRAWLRRELMGGRLDLHPDAVTAILEDLAHHMLEADTTVLEPGELQPVLAPTLRRLGVGLDRWPGLHRQLITCTLIRRSAADAWEFAHRSFQEFFCARKFLRWEEETGGRGEFPVTHTPVWRFVAELALERWDEARALRWIPPRVDRQEEATLTLTTLRAAAAYWLLRRGSRPAREHPLAGVMLDSVALAGVGLAACDLSDADFHRADLRGADLSSTDLRRAVFALANLDGASLARADARWSDFRRATLAGADLRGALLQDAQLEGARFTGARLTDARWQGAIVGNADFRGADFGAPGSAERAESLAALRGCEGNETALFDDPVSAAPR